MNGKILIFSKAPVPGEVKTRLIPTLGEQGAAAVQWQLLHHALTTAMDTCAACELWCAPDASHPAFDPFREQYAVEFYDQRGADLGERMSNAFSQTLQFADAAILIGSDCPGIYATYLRAALTTLANGCDAVIGPATDGGYVLIGMKRPTPELFTDMPWGSDQVLEMTRERLQQLDMTWRELPPMHDLDTPDDLNLFPCLQQIGLNQADLSQPDNETCLRL